MGGAILFALRFTNGIYAAVIAAILLTSSFARAEKRVALVVGNSNYETVAKLANPINDAQLVTNFFREMKFDVVEMKSNVNLQTFRAALREFTNLAENADVAAVFFAGHGMELGGTNYLIPVDAKLNTDLDVEDETISLDRVLRALEPVKKIRLVILDACRNNPFIPRMRKLSITTRSTGRGLADPYVTTRNTLVAFAARAGSLAQDGKGSNSPFTRALVAHLGTPGLDLRIAFGRIRDQVYEETQQRQEPWMYGTLGGTIISFVPDSSAPPSAGVQDDSAVTDFQRAEKLNTVVGWQAFLRLHPTGQLAEKARTRLKELAPWSNDTPDDTSFIFSAWTKFCGIDSKDLKAKEICLTVKEARLDSGQFVAGAALIEQEGETRKSLRVTLPLGMQVKPGTRLAIDDEQPLTGGYVVCLPNGCMADFDVTAEFVRKMKNGQTMRLLGINLPGQEASYRLPLADFAKAYEGPAEHPKVFEEQQKKLQEELQRRAEEARKRLQGR
jgi:invasion protein IalB